MINFVIGFFAGTSVTIFIINLFYYHAESITTEIESEPDHNTPQFTRRAGEGLEEIKTYGHYPL